MIGALLGHSWGVPGHAVAECDHTSALTCKVPCRKDWQSAAIRAVLTVNPGRPECSEILPRRLSRRGGASVVRRQSRRIPNGGSQCRNLSRNEL
jgi:hypothetical protein